MANITTQTIRVDLSTDKVLPTAFTHQNDTARTLEFSMYNKGMPYTMTGNTVKFAYKSPIVNGQYSVIAGASMASGTVSENKVSVTLPSEYTAISGVGMLTMIITPTSGTVRPVNIRLVVQKSADGDDVVAGASDMPDYLAEVAEQYYSQYVTQDVDDLGKSLKSVGNISYTKTSGYIGSNGAINDAGASTAEVYTSKFSALPNQSFSFTLTHTTPRKNWCAYACYDENQNFISRTIFVSESDTTSISVSEIITIPTTGTYKNTRYISFTWRTYSDSDEIINIANLNEELSSVSANVVAPLIMTASQTANPFVEVVITPDVNILKIPSDTLVCTNSGYMQMNANDVVIDISSTSITSTAIKVCFNTSTHEFDLVPYNEIISNNQILICEIRRSNTVPSVNINCRYTLNGQPFGLGVLPSADNIHAINHRGYNSVAPENTLPAFALSAIKGYKYVECDVQMTSDGVPVLLHDTSINRTARNADGSEISGTIYIADITYEQALQYDFGIWKGSKYAGTKIPTLDEFILLCRNLGLSPYIEIIRGSLPETIRQYVAVVKKYSMTNRTTWIATNTSNLNQLHIASPNSRLGYVVDDITQTIIDAILEYKDDNEVFVDCDYRYITDEKISLAISNNIPVETWIVDDRNTLLGLNPYITGITSNNRNASDLLYQYNIKDYIQ